MQNEVLPTHNLHLSGATNLLPGPIEARQGGHSERSAINCTRGVEDYVRAGIAPATRAAYSSDIAQFRAWGGTIPSSDEEVAFYLAEHAKTHATATLTRRLAAISVAHGAHGFPSPTSSPLVRATMRGIRREHGIGQKQARALLREDLFAILGPMGKSLKDVRDRALLLVGFAGGFRRSELTALDVDDLEFAPKGLILTIRRSKTDQEGRGRKIGVPLGRTKWCPVGALSDWLAASAIERGPIFHPISRHGHVFASRLSGDAVCVILRDRLRQAGYNPAGYSGHSLRAGLVTSAAQAGVSSSKIRAQTGHVSEQMLARYIRDGEVFTNNAAGALL